MRNRDQPSYPGAVTTSGPKILAPGLLHLRGILIISVRDYNEPIRAWTSLNEGFHLCSDPKINSEAVQIKLADEPIVNAEVNVVK